MSKPRAPSARSVASPLATALILPALVIMDALQTATRGMLAEWMAGTTRKDDALYMVLTALCMVVVVVHLLSHRRVLGRLASQLSQQDATLQQLMTRLNQVAATTANLESSQQDGHPPAVDDEAESGGSDDGKPGIVHTPGLCTEWGRDARVQ